MSGHGIGRREFVKGVCAVALAGSPWGHASQMAGNDPPATRPGQDLPVVPLDAPDWLSAPEALFRPTAQGATVHWVARDAVQAQVLAGTSPERLAPVADLTATGPAEALLTGFAADTDVYYRCRFRRVPDEPWVERPLQRFHTARPAGSSFRVALIADTHGWLAGQMPAMVPNINKVIATAVAEKPDFVIFLGDEAGIRAGQRVSGVPGALSQARAAGLWGIWRRLYAPLLAAVPSYMVLGNHEGEGGFQQEQATDFGTCYYQRWGTIARKQYCLNPLPDTYPEGGENEGWVGASASPATGGADEGNRSPLQNYYAWTWGDALFVVLDVCRYTRIGAPPPTRPEQWTLGPAQLAWLERTLAQSKARWKLVVAHHLVGGWARDNMGRPLSADGYAYGRGGARYARVGEQARITDLMRTHGARLFLYGHDHTFVHQQAEGLHFVCCGRSSLLDPGWFRTSGWQEAYGDYRARAPQDFHAALGFTRLAVEPDGIRVAYVRTGTDPRGAENVAGPEGTVVYECQLP